LLGFGPGFSLKQGQFHFFLIERQKSCHYVKKSLGIPHWKIGRKHEAKSVNRYQARIVVEGKEKIAKRQQINKISENN
jgi:hypothetical protein